MNTAEHTLGDESGIRLILRSLRGRNYRLFFFGQGVSLVGTWMQSVALAWLVYRLTNSALYLGVVGFSTQILTFALTPLAGVIADRASKHRIVIATQTLAMAQSIALFILFEMGLLDIWGILGMSVFLGLVNAFDMPTRQAFIYELVDKQEDLPNAIALNSVVFNGARLVGPPIAGLLIERWDEGMCFLFNGLSFLAVIFALALIKPAKRVPSQNGRVLAGLADGLRYSFGFQPIRSLLLLLGSITVLGMSYGVLMPIFARDILGGGPRTLGFLLSSIAAGALVGAIYMASRRSIRRLGRVIVISICIFGCGLVAVSLSGILWLTLLILPAVGFGLMVQVASINTVLQTIVDDDKRARVMSLYVMALIGTMPLGSLLAGSVAEAIGAPHTMFVSGLLCVVAAAVFATRLPMLRRIVRPIYIKKGIIREVAAGIGAARGMPAEARE